MKDKKAPGEDGLYNEIIKTSIDIIYNPLSEILKACIKTGYVPKIWQQSRSAIIPKNGKTDYSKARSYRIIALSANLLKLLENLVLWHLQDDLKMDEALNQKQYGFRKGHSTDTAILNLIEDIQTALKHNHHALGIFLDIEGAFDNIPHSSIKKAIDRSAAKGMIGDWIYYMVSNRYITLKAFGTKLICRTPKGCPQGGVLSPFL